MTNQKDSAQRTGGLRVLALLAIVLGMVTVSCVTPPIAMETPEGFAVFSHPREVRAISPEGVVVRSRTVSNDPPQSIGFWAEALERQLTESGYLLVEKSDFSIETGDGVLLEWLAPVSEDDWIYLTAIAVVDNQIAIVEAAGPTDQYELHRSAIRNSLKSLRIDS